MLAARGLQTLAYDLAAAIGSMGLQAGGFGKPELVEMPTREAERIFQGYAKAKPSKEDAYAAARAFLRDQELDSWQYDLIAAAVAEPVREQAGAMVLGSTRFPALIAGYEEEAGRGDLWRLTWHGLLYSYFNFDPSATKDEASRRGWEALRAFLERTWPLIDRQAGNVLVPDWVSVLRKESEVLTINPANKYARAYLRGDSAATEQLAADLGIPPSSWFWHALVLGAVRQAISDSEAEFRRLVPQLLQLIHGRPAFRDEALEAILVRYYGCKGAPQDERLRDYVCEPTVWKNPKLKAAGIATAWNRVPDPVWHMVLSWVNERNLKDFFDILAARNKADEGRLAFWSKYLKQITWTRLVFGADTMALKRTNQGIRELIAREEGAYAQLTGKREVDAFLMQIGSYLIIEFSKKPNACYVYQADQLPFEPYARHYDGGSDDLAAGYRQDQECSARIVHREGWEGRAAEELKRLGIRPDQPEVQRVTPTRTAGTSTGSAHTVDASTRQRTTAQREPDMAILRALIGRFRNASINDKREGASGGRLWVDDPLQRASLATELRAMGFRWANSKQAWYFPET
uniref:Zorya protein ZorC EH domain-containing protein n=1 Tax=Variovorax paradoxus (strain S110) TaxID=543728 RepID=C5CL41_VARPS